MRHLKIDCPHDAPDFSKTSLGGKEMEYWSEVHDFWDAGDLQ